MEPFGELSDFFSSSRLWSAAGLFKKTLRCGLTTAGASSSEGGSSGISGRSKCTGPASVSQQHKQQQQQGSEQAAEREVHSKRFKAGKKQKAPSSEEVDEADDRNHTSQAGSEPSKPYSRPGQTRARHPIPTFLQQQLQQHQQHQLQQVQEHQQHQQLQHQQQQQQHYHEQQQQRAVAEQEGVDVHTLILNHPTRPRTQQATVPGLPRSRTHASLQVFSTRFLHMLNTLPSSATAPPSLLPQPSISTHQQPLEDRITACEDQLGISNSNLFQHHHSMSSYPLPSSGSQVAMQDVLSLVRNQNQAPEQASSESESLDSCQQGQLLGKERQCSPSSPFCFGN